MNFNINTKMIIELLFNFSLEFIKEIDRKFKSMKILSIHQFISQKEYQLVLSRNLKERVMESASFLCGFI